MRPTLLAIAMAALLAGCADPAPLAEDGGTAADGMGAHGMHDAATHILAPEWAPGDSWTLSSPQQPEPFTHVVTADAGDDWVVDTDSTTTAYFDARFDISFLGKVRKSDLAGSQGSTRVEFLRFPLAKDLEWTTTWDGEPMAVKVLDVASGKATVQAHRADGSLYAEYAYDSNARYFSRFAFYAPDGATVGFEWSLQSSGPFSGNAVRWTLEELFATSGPVPQNQYGVFNVAPGFTDVYVDGLLQCEEGAVVLAVGPFTGPAEDRGYSNTGPCPIAAGDSYAVAAPAQAEQWGVLLSSTPTTVGTLELHVFGRTLAEVPVTPS